MSKYRVSYYSNVIFKLFGGYLSFSKNRRVSRKWFQFVQVIQHITSLPPKMNVRKVKLLHFIPPGNRLSKNIIIFFSKVTKNLTIHDGDNFVKLSDTEFFKASFLESLSKLGLLIELPGLPWEARPRRSCLNFAK